MQHVTGVGDRHHLAVRDVREPAPDARQSCRWRLRPPDDRRATAGCSSPPPRPTASAPRCCARPRRSPRSGTPSETATGAAGRTRGESARPAALRPNARARKTRLVARQSRIALLQPVRDGIEARVGREVLRIGERVEPFRDLVRRGGRFLGAHAESVERDHAAHARRAHAGVVQHDIAAEAVPGDIRPLRRARTPARSASRSAM